MMTDVFLKVLNPGLTSMNAVHEKHGRGNVVKYGFVMVLLDGHHR